MAHAVGWAPIIKSEKTADGTLRVTGKAADSSVDRDYQIADEAWLDKAMGAWYGEPDGGNIREQHDGKRAVGTAIEYRKGDDGVHYITAEIVDPVTVAKIDKNVLKGFSWSARNARVTVDKSAAGGRIVDGQIYEVSVVDRPANPGCRFTIAKADGPDGDADLELVEEPELEVEVDKTETTDAGVIEKTDEPRFTPADMAAILKSLGKPKNEEPAEAPAEKADDGETTKAVSADERKEMADKGIAMPNGDFPIPDEGHLRSAVGHLGKYTGDEAAAKKHIIKRAKALKLTNLLPDAWGVSKAFTAVAALDKALEDAGFHVSKVDADAAAGENVDIADGKAAIAAIARLIISEAEELAEGHLCEIDDIQTLVSAACALQYFVQSEAQEVTSQMPPTAAAEPTTEVTVSVETGKADDATTTETPAGAPAAPVEKTDASDETLTKDDLSHLLESTIAKAVAPYKDELDLVKGQLAKVLETPRPDGPARTRTTAHTAAATKADVLRTEIALCKTQLSVTSGDLQKGYRMRLDEAEDELQKLTDAAS